LELKKVSDWLSPKFQPWPSPGTMAGMAMGMAIVGTGMGKETVGLQETPATAGMGATEATAATPEIAETVAMLATAAAAETQEVRAAQATMAARTAMPEEPVTLREAMPLATATATVLAMTVPVKADLQAKAAPRTLEEPQAEATHPRKGTHPGTAALRAPQRMEGCRGF
jgi:hypothetical protein